METKRGRTKGINEGARKKGKHISRSHKHSHASADKSQTSHIRSQNNGEEGKRVRGMRGRREGRREERGTKEEWKRGTEKENIGTRQRKY